MVKALNCWLIYFKERFPISTYALLVGGLSLSGRYLAFDSPTLREVLRGNAFWASFIGLFLFFAELRLMDELKDHGKDKVAHPDRPLPRGILSPEQVSRVIVILILAMAAYAGFVSRFTYGWAGDLYIFLTFYLWAMYKEFYVGEWLSERPILYAVTHQLVLIPLCFFAIACALPGWDFLGFRQIGFSLSVLGAFFTYEVSRKLDPGAHPILKTYLSLYGPKGTAVLVLVTTGVAAFGAFGLKLGALLWPFEALVCLCLPLLVFRPKAFKWIETLATLSLLVHLWAIPLQHLLRWPR